MNRYNAQILIDKGKYHLQFETDNRENFDAMEKLAQKIMDNKSRTNYDKITESVDALAEHLVVSIDMDLGGLRHRAGDGKLCATWEEAVQRTKEWLQKECE